MNDSSLQQKWLQTANGKICYYLAKQFDDRPTVIFLHGLSANHTTWKTIFEKFRDFNLNYLAPDLRGHGHSDKSKKRRLYKFSVFTDDLKQIIEKENLSKVVLVGYSFGGSIALDYAIKYPTTVEGLVLISANHVNPLKYKKINFLTPLGYIFLNLLAWLLIWQKRKNYYYFDQATARGYWQSTFKGFTTMPITINLWLLSELANLNLSHQLAKITCPTLIVKSQADPFLSPAEAKDMNQKIKNSKIIILEDRTHFLASRCQEKIAKIISDFLKEQKII